MMSNMASVPYIPAYPIEELDAVDVEGAEAPTPVMMHSQSYHVGMGAMYRTGNDRYRCISASSGSNTSSAASIGSIPKVVERDIPSLPNLQYAATAKAPRNEA